jgi:pimeloyl-ACP methyl ester carboxylesterase
MKRIFVGADATRVAPLRVVLIPGAYSTPEDFLREGFATAVEQRRLNVDLEFVAADLPHLLDRSLLASLHENVIRPARAAGVRSLWLGGVSLGSFISLLYAARHRRELDGLCLLAPYLGNRGVTGEIVRAGGLRSWSATAVGSFAASPDDEERSIWKFLAAVPREELRLFLGFARGDRFIEGQRLLAEALPSEDTFSVDGLHDWPAWRTLWAGFLDRIVAPTLASMP